MPVFHLAKAMNILSKADPSEHREEEFRKLFQAKQEKTEGKIDIANHIDHSLHMPCILEDFRFYCPDIKHNWNSMTNTWYQNHRDWGLHARKTALNLNKNERPVNQVRPETAYQPQMRKVQYKCSIYLLYRNRMR
jgi:hypothetical protein